MNMKYSSISKTLLFPMALLIASCSHMQILGPQSDWLGKTMEFPLYSITVPNDTRWWFSSADQKSQSISLVVPAADKTREVLKDGQPSGMVLIQTSGGPTHPDAYTLYDGMADVYITPIPDGMKDIPNQTAIDGYLHDDAALYGNAGMLKPNAQYQVGQTKCGTRDFTYSQLELGGKGRGYIYLACCVVTIHEKRYLLAGRLWSDQSPQQDFEYLATLLSSVETR